MPRWVITGLRNKKEYLDKLFQLAKEPVMVTITHGVLFLQISEMYAMVALCVTPAEVEEYLSYKTSKDAIAYTVPWNWIFLNTKLTEEDQKKAHNEIKG